ncbi:MAG: sugar phosphate isomerase/epimerase family protein [Bryobacteraceae bacterium]
MRYGVNTLIWTAGFDLEHLPLLETLKARGFDGIEIARFSFDGFPAAEVRRKLDETGLEPVLCSALTGQLNLVSPDPAVRARTRDFLAQGIRTAGSIGARRFVGPFVAPVGYLPGHRRTEQEWEFAVEGLCSLVPVLEEHGVTMAVEPLNRFETYCLNTAADAAALCDAVGSSLVGVLFDTFHANIEEKSMREAIRTLGPHLKHMHTCENDRGIPGSGHVEWGEVFAALGETGYDDWMVIESFGFSIKEIAAAACIWRDLASSPDAIAFEGLKFLKGQALAAAGRV